ncbi:hypothetical protein J7M23_06995, partial [Candidatus Sumerlaeota bacterium]|nr:hypothetical protein [Candidatus Sumerlaeota bacterium]
AFQRLKDNVFQQRAPIPEATWLTNPSAGIIAGYGTVNGEPADGTIVSIGESVNRSMRLMGLVFTPFFGSTHKTILLPQVILATLHRTKPLTHHPAKSTGVSLKFHYLNLAV